MKAPQGYDKAKPSQVCKLNRSLYELKQASWGWNDEFSTNLQAYAFQQSAHNRCLLIKTNNGRFLALVVYVDDVLITGSDYEDIIVLKCHLDVAFNKDLGFVTYFLGVEISHSSEGTYLSQLIYITSRHYFSFRCRAIIFQTC